MKVRFFVPILAGWLFAAGICFAERVDAAEAFALLPEKYRSGVVKLSADNADPLPATWYFIAHNANRDGALWSITVTGGEIVKEEPSLDVRAIFKNPASIDLARMEAGALAAWQAAVGYSEGKDRKLGSVSYVLQQDGEGAVPVWSVWCYDKGGSYFGMLKVSATSGEILSTE